MGIKSFISKKVVSWLLPDIWKNLTGKSMPVNPNDYAIKLEAIKDSINKELDYNLIKKSWWDSFIDGINRLVRPLFSYGLFILFIIAYIDIEAFKQYMIALSSAPEMFWVIALTIIAAWFGERIITRSVENGALKNISPKKVLEKFKEGDEAKKELDNAKETEEAFLARIKNENNRMSDSDIVRWNEIKSRYHNNEEST